MRTKLHILKTIAKQLALKPNALNLFKKSVFGAWLNIKTEEHDNHMLHFLLLHQRRIENANTKIPFYFDIGHHTLEFGRKEFCLLTGFRFGDVSLKHFEDCVSSFRARVFPKIAKVKGYDIQHLNNYNQAQKTQISTGYRSKFTYAHLISNQLTSSKLLICRSNLAVQISSELQT